VLRLSYRSVPTAPMSHDDVIVLVRDARRRNEADDITGMLIYDTETFYQILEGEEAEVEACFDRISRDPRHEILAEAGRQLIVERAFKSWRMGSIVYDPATPDLTLPEFTLRPQLSPETPN